MEKSTWQARIREHLAASGALLRRMTPGMTYGALSAATLMPLITTVQGGELAALFGLANIVGGIGGNLIANQIQSWQDRSEEEIARDLDQLAETPDWQEALDKLIHELETPRIVQETFSEADWRRFQDLLRQELTELGNLPRYEVYLSEINTDGGAVVGRDVNVHNGDFVGRDQENMDAQASGSAAVAQGGGAAATTGGVAVAGNTDDVFSGDHNLKAAGHIIIAAEGATVITGDLPVNMSAVDRESALGRYLELILSRNRYLQLQGIRSGGKLVHIELDRVYVQLRATRQRIVDVEEAWLQDEAGLAPGEGHRLPTRPEARETVTLSVEDALAENKRIVILGDPGSGKTTLLRYLALLYARDLAEGTMLVADRLDLPESGHLPVLLPLRQISAYLRNHHPNDDGTDGHALLLNLLFEALKNQRLTLPIHFFDEWLQSGKAVILLDGLDEVAEPEMRRRVARLVEAFCQAYPECRYVVSSRIVGYTGAARLGDAFITAVIRDFSLKDVEDFLTNWHRLIAIGQMGPGKSAEDYALQQTTTLMNTIRRNDRIRELAINPLLLTVIAMVHRDRVKLPDRRAELYAEAVDVFLGKWDEAKGVQEIEILPDARIFDTGDKRVLLQTVALHMHERRQKEIDREDLRLLLRMLFFDILQDDRAAEHAVDRFLLVIEERIGLLTARGEGTYAFSHLTFQEYFAALSIAAQDDYIAYTLARASDPWWREVILLEAGYLSTQGKERITRLIQAIANRRDEPEPYHNLVFASQCLQDVGENRVQGAIGAEIYRRLRKELDTPLTRNFFSRFLPWGSTTDWVERRSRAVDALVAAGQGFWSQPYGEPEWVVVPAGEFWMGSDSGDAQREGDESPQHRLFLERFLIAKTPTTNAQYYLFTRAAEHPVPEHWLDGRPPKGLESHPVVNVTLRDAIAYCRWLSAMTGKMIALPSEAEWEKAARGAEDKRVYPWGDEFEVTRCNSRELKLGTTTPVGIFPNGSSPYGCLDMAGNVWEWTRSQYDGYPYPSEGFERQAREDLGGGDRRVLRGGSFGAGRRDVRCAYRNHWDPVSRISGWGFRVLSPGL